MAYKRLTDEQKAANKAARAEQLAEFLAESKRRSEPYVMPPKHVLLGAMRPPVTVR